MVIVCFAWRDEGDVRMARCDFDKMLRIEQERKYRIKRRRRKSKGKWNEENAEHASQKNQNNMQNTQT